MSGNMNLGITSSSVLTTYPQTMTCIVDGTNIIQVDFYGNRQRIGVTQSAYDELEKISNEYYNKLVELKVITPPKTSEEIQQEQTQLMADMLKEMQNMKEETTRVMDQNGVHANKYDWYYLMNMLHSDYSNLWGEDVAQYVKFAKAYINDPDAGAGKVFYLWRAGKHHH